MKLIQFNFSVHELTRSEVQDDVINCLAHVTSCWHAIVNFHLLNSLKFLRLCPAAFTSKLFHICILCSVWFHHFSFDFFSFFFLRLLKVSVNKKYT